MTKILNGKCILENSNEIKGVKNAYDAYELTLELNPEDIKDLLKAHKLMMKDLVSTN